MAENTNSEDEEVVQWVETPAELERRPDCESAEPTQTHPSVEMDWTGGGQGNRQKLLGQTARNMQQKAMKRLSQNKVEGENRNPRVAFDFTRAQWHVGTHVDTHECLRAHARSPAQIVWYSFQVGCKPGGECICC